jgi:hypothetical protein
MEHKKFATSFRRTVLSKLIRYTYFSLSIFLTVACGQGADVPLQDVVVDDSGVDGQPAPDISEGVDPGTVLDSTNDVEAVELDTSPDLFAPDGDTNAACLENEECAWLNQECETKTAVLEIFAMDVWAQPQEGHSITIEGPGPETLTVYDTALVELSLCSAVTLTIKIEAEDHIPFEATLVYAGSGETQDMNVEVTGGETGMALTTDLRTTEGTSTRHYLVFAGLVHKWFAASGPPARRGNQLTLMRSGEEAWSTVALELALAETQVTAASWWWKSELELVRDPDTHAFLSSDERWSNTILGQLQTLGAQGVTSKVLVNQFFNEEGPVPFITVDALLLAAAANPSDGIQYMGQGNSAGGDFTVTMEKVSFSERVLSNLVLPDASEVIQGSEITPPLSPYLVHTGDLPGGLYDIYIASWHQKFLTIDHEVAFVGGMNIKTTDWDTTEHAIFDHRRMEFDATVQERLDVLNFDALPDFGPRKDYMVQVKGPIVFDAEVVFGRRWDTLIDWGTNFSNLATPMEVGPMPEPLPDGVQAQIVTTMPPPWEKLEIADTLLRAIGQAEHYIFIEDQYFRAPILATAILNRMSEKEDLVLIVVTKAIDEWLDPGCWHTYTEAQYFQSLYPDRFRLYQLRSFAAYDVACPICFSDVTAQFKDIDVHSKLMIIDDVYMQVGSCNHNNRGLLYEGEMGVAVFDDTWVAEERRKIFGHLLGPTFTEPVLTVSDFIGRFDSASSWNQSVFESWEALDFSLQLSEESLPSGLVPSGLLYPLEMGVPSDCFLENVSPDLTLGVHKTVKGGT